MAIGCGRYSLTARRAQASAASVRRRRIGRGPKATPFSAGADLSTICLVAVLLPAKTPGAVSRLVLRIGTSRAVPSAVVDELSKLRHAQSLRLGRVVGDPSGAWR